MRIYFISSKLFCFFNQFTTAVAFFLLRASHKSPARPPSLADSRSWDQGSRFTFASQNLRGVARASGAMSITLLAVKSKRIEDGVELRASSLLCLRERGDA